MENKYCELTEEERNGSFSISSEEANEILDRFEKKVMKFADEHHEQFKSITDLIK